MRVFASLFLILFLADGGCSLLDEIVTLLAPMPPLAELRGLISSSVIVMAVPLYLGLGIDRRLPKRVFLPLILYVFWCPVSAWVFPFLAGSRTYGLLMAVGQVLLCLLPISLFRKNDEPFPLLPQEMFAVPFFSLRNTLIFGGANLFVVPLVLLLCVFCAANAFMAEYTSGFMRLAPGGLHMTERVYRRDNRTIRLVGMIHLGERQYYDDLVGSVAPGRTIVLAEGVTDDRKLLRNRLDYGKIAGVLGLTSQEKMLFRGRLIGEEDLEGAPPRGAAKPGPVHILRADVDVSSFRPQTIHFLDALGKHLMEDSSGSKWLLPFDAWAGENITPEMNKTIMDDILYRRNREVIRYMRKALLRYDNIVIPWGALHMAEIEAEVLAQGFKLQQERERVSIDFWKMLRGS